ncbi:sulfite reductase, beta subunit (hemoprotein) [Chthonomonas calidirosea]|uniref:Sulfite reductase, beta subunit (Hemoprotein) n=1 Tax=Chthonomonas calidirosea (strain DSM 23976 / ICMP 18418 / T49) TaxID=1303518 RepID=S0ET72_CHTCT|nr:sulfite reductase subunit beta [Chthonomonas calidirosea]CCW34584.1 Sulfite reductase, beta subunit (hemoprotein) [Chthonomonas calidirosea T49]CEK14365.1 sulfite reductase, beta subunit (hemoprotein) [Chthonomonas calidirosea]
MAKADVEAIKKAKDGLDVWDDIFRYAKLGYDAIPPDDLQRFRWYGIYPQKPNVGHFMLRVKVPGGDLNVEQLRTIASITRDFARGFADITTRQNFQFHWLTIQDLPTVFERLHAVGLTTTGACGDITRNIAGCPVSGLDPQELYDTRPLIREVTNYFLGNKEFSDLPRKYKIVISGCSIHCAQPQINDVGLQAVRRFHRGKSEVGFHLYVGGGLSTQPHFAKKLDVFIKPEQVLEVCIAVTKIFRDDGYRQRRNHARLKFLVADWGPERFREELIKRLGWTPEPAVPVLEPIGPVQQDHLGVHRQKQADRYWVGTSVLTGRVTDAQLFAAADIAERYCEGNIRTTNQQNLLFPNIKFEDLNAAIQAIQEAGFLVEASEFHKGAVCCTGNEFCNLAITETKHRLREIISYLESRMVWDEPIRIHLNGCPNSCGQHHIGDIGLQGCLARLNDGTQVEAYDVCLGGRLGGDAKFVRPISRKVPADKVKYAIENLLVSFRCTRKEGESFGQWVDRHTNEELAEFLGLHLLAQDDPTWTPPPPRAHAPVEVE